MSLDITRLTQEQIVWYAKLLETTILADDEIAASEVKFIKSTLKYVNDEGARKELVSNLESGTLPPLTQPVGFNKFQLAEIHSQLVEICISDLELIKREEALLQKVGRLFDFHDVYTREMLNWGREGLEVKAFQQKLVSKKINDEEFIVPVKKLDTEQKKWYIDVLVAALIIEGVKEEREVSLLKKMLLSATTKEEQVVLRHHVLKQHRPPLKRPPKMHEELLIMIFMEVIQIFTSKGDIGYHGSQLLKLMADLSRMPTKSYTDVMDWCNRMIAWKLRRRQLVAAVRLNTSLEDQEAESKGLLSRHPSNNSVQVRKVKCFVCDNPGEFSFFQLKQHSQKPRQNIFYIQTYEGAAEGFDLIDFNRIKVTVCPHCLFATIHRKLFLLSDRDKTPTELGISRFKDPWVEGKDRRMERLGEHKDELFDIHRSDFTVVQSYELAIEAALAISLANDSDNWAGQVVTLRLHQAEVLMKQGNVKEAESKLKDALAESERLYIRSKNNPLVFRCARILLLGALYFKDDRNMGQYYEFFRRFETDKFDFLEKEEQTEFNRIFTDVKNIWDRREFYEKQELDGFHLRNYSKEAKEAKKAAESSED
ncbi:MAG: hypothetical protein RRB13_01815 [bacterium]|nr:hypothetical protein [bacterium]